MNNKRRKSLRIAMDGLGYAKDLLTEIVEAEEEAYFNMPEGLQESERGQQMESNIDTLNELIETIETALDEMECM